MKIPPFKRVFIDQTKPYKDPFRVAHDRNMVIIRKNKAIEKRHALHDRQEKHLKEIKEEKLVMKENNERWKQLNVIS